MPDPVRWPHPAYEVHTSRTVLRCYGRGDVDEVHAAVLDNAEALRPWMPWVRREPVDRTERLETLRSFRGRFDLGLEFLYGIFDRDGGRYLGGCGLHPRATGGPRILEIGYWIVPARWGEGLATEVAGALTRVGFEVMDADRLELRIAPDNARSLAVAAKLGYRREGTLRGVGDVGDHGPTDLTVFGMLRGDLAASPAEGIEIHTETF